MYDESYLNEVVETQGELFGKVDEHVPEIDIYDFIEKYMNGKTRAYIDQGQAYYQWYYKMTSRQVIKKIPVDFIVAGYRGLHDLELELAVQKVHEQLEKRR